MKCILYNQPDSITWTQALATDIYKLCGNFSARLYVYYNHSTMTLETFVNTLNKREELQQAGKTNLFFARGIEADELIHEVYRKLLPSEQRFAGRELFLDELIGHPEWIDEPPEIRSSGEGATAEKPIVSFSALKYDPGTKARFVSLLVFTSHPLFGRSPSDYLGFSIPDVEVLGTARIEQDRMIELPIHHSSKVYLTILEEDAAELRVAVKVKAADDWREPQRQAYTIHVDSPETIYSPTNVFDVSIIYKLGYWSSQQAFERWLEKKQKIARAEQDWAKEAREYVSKERAGFIKQNTPERMDTEKPLVMPDINSIPKYRAVKPAPSEPIEKRLTGVKRLCRSCSAPISSEMRVCPNCGALVGRAWEDKEFDIIVEAEPLPDAEHRFACVTICNRTNAKYIIESLCKAGFIFEGEYDEVGIIRGDAQKDADGLLYKNYRDYREGDIVLFRRRLWNKSIEEAHRAWLEAEYSHDVFHRRYTITVELRHVRMLPQKSGGKYDRRATVNEPLVSGTEPTDRRVIHVCAEGGMDKESLYHFIRDQGYDAGEFENWPTVTFPFEDGELETDALACEIGDRTLIMLPQINVPFGAHYIG